MNNLKIYRPQRRLARTAGIGYVVVAMAALPNIVRKKLIIPGDAATTAGNILEKVFLIRLSIIGDVLTELAFLFVGLCLYRLLKKSGQDAARSMLALVAIAVGITIFSTGLEVTAIRLFEAGDIAHGGLLLEAFGGFMVTAAIFFGLWMLPLGYLFLKADFMPTSLGIVLMIGSSGYVIHAAYQILAPDVAESFINISVIAEVAVILWLLLVGVKKSPITTHPD